MIAPVMAIAVYLGDVGTGATVAADLDLRAFARSVDALRDVEPVERVVFRAPAAVERVMPEFMATPTLVKAVPGAGRVDLELSDGGDRHALAGSFLWSGNEVRWRWHRVSTGRYGKGLESLDGAFPAMTVVVTMADGEVVHLEAPPARVRVALARGQDASVSLPAPKGVPVELEADANATWALSAPEADGSRVLSCAEASIDVRHDPGNGRAVLCWLDPVGQELRALQKRLADLERELPRRNDAERPFVQQDIDAVRTRLRQLADAPRLDRFPPAPALRLRGPGGRDFAILTIESR
jgi:hypothetical protein